MVIKMSIGGVLDIKLNNVKTADISSYNVMVEYFDGSTDNIKLCNGDNVIIESE